MKTRIDGLPFPLYRRTGLRASRKHRRKMRRITDAAAPNPGESGVNLNIRVSFYAERLIFFKK